MGIYGIEFLKSIFIEYWSSGKKQDPRLTTFLLISRRMNDEASGES